MNLEDFRVRIKAPLIAYSLATSGLHVEIAYRDLINIYSVIQEYLSETSQYDYFDLIYSGNQKLGKQILEKNMYTLTLLKALFVFADSFVSELLGEVIGKPGLSFHNFLMKPKYLIDKISIDQLLPTYCINIYRNKLIVHHDFVRLTSGIFGKDVKTLRLIPFSKNMQIADIDYEAVIKLRDKYATSISEIGEEINYYKLLKKLYYGIPIGTFGKINGDRTEINKIAELGGCESLTPIEIIEAIDQFAVGICNVLG